MNEDSSQDKVTGAEFNPPPESARKEITGNPACDGREAKNTGGDVCNQGSGFFLEALAGCDMGKGNQDGARSHTE